MLTIFAVVPFYPLKLPVVMGILRVLQNNGQNVSYKNSIRMWHFRRFTALSLWCRFSDHFSFCFLLIQSFRITRIYTSSKQVLNEET